MRLQLLDTLLEISAPPDVLAALRGLFPDLDVPTGPVLRVTLRDGCVQLGDEPPGRPVPPARYVEELLVAINAAAIAGVRSFAVHAGAVASGDGVLAWPGVSGAGKSTLTAACLQAGFAYVSDEALALRDGLVLPYPKPLSLSAWSLHELSLPGVAPGAVERAVAPTELGAELARAPLRPRHLLALARHSGPPALEPAEPGALAMLLLEFSFNHYRDPAAAFREATTAAQESACWTLHYDGPREAAALLRDRLG